MIIFSEYTIATGILTGRRIWGSPEQLLPNVSDGCSLALGVFNADVQRIDHATGIVSNIPADAQARYSSGAPSPWHRWDRERLDWVDPRSDELRAQMEHDQARAKAMARVLELEGNQARAVRDALLTGDLTRVRAIEDEIAALRPIFSAEDS